jgi:hypothetical protein
MVQNEMGVELMSWTDRGSIKVIKFLRDKYKSKMFVETGTYKGVNMQLQIQNFVYYAGCESNRKYTKEAFKRATKINKPNIFVWNVKSPQFLKEWKEKDIFVEPFPIIYLDAHFYNKKLPKNKRFVVKDELNALRGMRDCIIIIHDFANGLGHIKYDGIDLDMKILNEGLYLVNPQFHFYTNTLEGCDIIKTKKDVEELGLDWDDEMKSTLKFVWSKPEKTFRGILYCLPTALTKEEMEELKLREWQ